MLQKHISSEEGLNYLLHRSKNGLETELYSIGSIPIEFVGKYTIITLPNNDSYNNVKFLYKCDDSSCIFSARVTKKIISRKCVTIKLTRGGTVTPVQEQLCSDELSNFIQFQTVVIANANTQQTRPKYELPPRKKHKFSI
jgi:hypothetical protein